MVKAEDERERLPDEVRWYSGKFMLDENSKIILVGERIDPNTRSKIEGANLNMNFSLPGENPESDNCYDWCKTQIGRPIDVHFVRNRSSSQIFFTARHENDQIMVKIFSGSFTI